MSRGRGESSRQPGGTARSLQEGVEGPRRRHRASGRPAGDWAAAGPEPASTDGFSLELDARRAKLDGRGRRAGGSEDRHYLS